MFHTRRYSIWGLFWTPELWWLLHPWIESPGCCLSEENIYPPFNSPPPVGSLCWALVFSHPSSAGGQTSYEVSSITIPPELGSGGGLHSSSLDSCLSPRPPVVVRRASPPERGLSRPRGGGGVGRGTIPSLFLLPARPCLCSRFMLWGLPFISCSGGEDPFSFILIFVASVLFIYLFFISFFIDVRPFTALYSCLYVLRTFDKTNDVASYGTVPRTFVQDTVVCWLVATTACSCGFRTIDIVWRGPGFLVPGFLRHPIPEGLVVGLIVLGRFSPLSSFRTVLLTCRTFDFVTYGTRILLLWLSAWACIPLVSLCSVCPPFV